MPTVQIHLANEEPVVAEVEKLPEPSDQAILCMNPRKRDGKQVHYILSEVTTVLFPLWRINLIQILPSGEEEEVETFIR
jgi:hypothetical protein